MRIRILSGYRGPLTSEQFVGPGEYDFPRSIADYLITNGHAVALQDDTPAPAPKADSDVPPAFENMTLAQLKDYANEHDVDITGLTRKSDLIAKLAETYVKP